MRDIIKPYVILTISALIVVAMWMGGADILDVTIVVFPISVLASVAAGVAHEPLDKTATYGRDGSMANEYEDITLDDLNDLLARIDGGELPGDRHVERPHVRTIETFYAGDAVYTVVREL